jgi:hypothetical protein
MKKYQKGLRVFSSHTRFEVGTTPRLDFCKTCCVGISLKLGFLKLFDIARSKDAFVANHLEFSR